MRDNNQVVHSAPRPPAPRGTVGTPGLRRRLFDKWIRRAQTQARRRAVRPGGLSCRHVGLLRSAGWEARITTPQAAGSLSRDLRERPESAGVE
jgi:hypothetical protein